MKTAVLLGAGASRDAGVPITTEMTEQIYDLTSPERGRDPDGRLRRALGTVIGGLIFQKGIRSQNPYEALNVEEVFASVQMLANRNDIEAAPFIGSWHSAVEELDQEPITRYQYDELYRAIRDSMAEEMGKAFKDISRPFSRTYSNEQIRREYEKQAGSSKPKYEWDKWIGNVLGDALSKLEKTYPPYVPAQRVRKKLGSIIGGNPTSGSGRVFQRLSNYMILSLRDMVWLEEGHDVSYLKPLLDLGSQRLSIYSLNYDNAIERLCQQNNVSYTVGITKSGALKFDQQARVHLLKLHGSIDWVASDSEGDQSSGSIETLLPMEVRLATPEQMSEELPVPPAIIFGQGSKLTTNGPYLDLLSLFRNDLEGHDRLLVVGYSFRDAHVNHYLARWITSRSDRLITILSGRDFRQEAHNIPFARNLLSYGRERITVLEYYAAEGLPRAVLDVQR